jgi:hypothetical protein
MPDRAVAVPVLCIVFTDPEVTQRVHGALYLGVVFWLYVWRSIFCHNAELRIMIYSWQSAGSMLGDHAAICMTRHETGMAPNASILVKFWQVAREDMKQTWGTSQRRKNWAKRRESATRAHVTRWVQGFGYAAGLVQNSVTLNTLFIGKLSYVKQFSRMFILHTYGLENREYGRRGSDALTTWHLLFPKKLVLTSPTSGSRSVGIVRTRTQATEFSFFM